MLPKKRNYPRFLFKYPVMARGYIDSRVKLTDIDKIDMPVEASTLAQLCDALVSCRCNIKCDNVLSCAK